jgi:uncharacterized Ntn-hydrolase superfamily protein
LFAIAHFLNGQNNNRPISTYSIVALDSKTKQLGVAVQSHWFSVGSVVPWAKSGVGAVATQSLAKIEYGPEGLALMEKGKTAQESLDILLAQDEGAKYRQVGMVDFQGNVASHTGSNCMDFAGFQKGKNYTVQANIMASPTVWPAMAEAYERAEGDLAERMMQALEAAEREGGDLRGRQSASMLIVKGEPSGTDWKDIVLELRVEDHPEPLKEMRRLIQIHRAYEHANRGDHYLAAGDMKAALKEYNAAAIAYPENPELPYWTAITLASSGEMEKALPLFKDVFERNPNFKTMTPAVAKSGFLPLDDKTLELIMSQ